MTGAVAKPKRSRRRLATVVCLTVGGLLILMAVVVAARWLRDLEPVHAFLVRYPGQTELPAAAPTGFPAWLGWQHFLNGFFMVLIIRSGWQVRTVKRPSACWTPRSSGLFRARRAGKKISLELWLHLSLDTLWILNGAIFIVLLVVSNQWLRIVPTSWDVVPNALSAGFQYLSLNWPVENGWNNYNSLQLLAYFVTVFVAAPLAVISGIRMSPVWPAGDIGINRAYPIEWARAVHLPVMIYFVAFIVVHVALVAATGVLRNLNHMYAMRDDETWWGLGIFGGSVVVMAGAWMLCRPLFLRPIARIFGKVTR